MSSSRPQTSSSAYADTNAHAFKRRHIRKGTFSCWECKRRKTRCEFKNKSSSVCVSCQHRGTSCVGQDFRDPAESRDAEVEDRVLQVEALVSQLVQRRSYQSIQTRAFDAADENNGDENRLDECPVQAAEINAEDNLGWPAPSLLTTAHKLFPDCRSLSSHLYTILPHPTEASLIMSRGKFSKLPIHVRGLSTKKIASSVMNVESVTQVSELPLPTAHPVEFARKLIQFALCLHQLKKPIYDAARRYVDIAARYVTSQDALMQSIEGIETLMLESCYHINVGNIRAAWLIVRRALAIAQLIGLPQQTDRADSPEENVWFRLVLGDRSLSWMLGLPLAIADDSFVSEHELVADAWSAKLERTHTIVFGRIITRNVRMQRRHRQSRPGQNSPYNDHRETQEIDDQLKQAAKSLPIDWWWCPTTTDASMHVNTMHKTEKLIAQMQHHYLLIILHQPYLIHKSLPTAGIAECVPSPFDDVYSQIAIHSASREMLSRFLVLRNFHRRLSYRGVDDKAFTAATMFLLVHLTGKHHKSPNVLEHQRPQDVGLVNEVISILEETSSTNEDKLSSSMVHVLKRLREMEAESAKGHRHLYMIWMEDDPVAKDSYQTKNNKDDLSLPMPYFGLIRIARKKPAALQPLAALRLDSICSAMFTPDMLPEIGDNNTADMCLDPTLPGATSFTNLQPQRVIPSQEATEDNIENVDLHFVDADMQYLWDSPIRTLREATKLCGTTGSHNDRDQDIDSSFLEPWLNEAILMEETNEQ